MLAALRPRLLIGISAVALAGGCGDDVTQKAHGAPAFTGVPAAPPGASGARIVERSGPKPFRNVYGPGGPQIPGQPPGVIPPPGGHPNPENPMELPPDPFEDEPLPPEAIEDEPGPGGEPAPQGIGL